MDPSQPPQPIIPPTDYQAVSRGSDDWAQRFLPTKNIPALLSYYFGVFGLIPLLGVPLAITAIILAIVGLNKFKQTPTPGAKGHAITGLVLGIFELVALIAFVVFVVIWSRID